MSIVIPRPERPHMPDYGISSKNEGMLTWDWVNTQLEKARNYWIGSTRPDGGPHTAPVWGVWLEGRLYFGSSRGSRKGRNLIANPRVTVHLESGDEVVIIEGRAEQVTEVERLRQIGKVYGEKYPPFSPDPLNEPQNLYIGVIPQVVLAWLEKDFPNTATRWNFETLDKK